jgi:predicted HicB family RNase H-like nuclease
MKKTTPAAIKLTVRLPVEMHAALVEAARTHNRSLNGELLTAVSDHLKKSQKDKR